MRMSGKILIHYHSDCPFFAGCENMLANFFNSEDFRQTHNVSFSYRYSTSYEQSFKHRVTRELPTLPVFFMELSDAAILPKGLPLLGKRLIMAFLRLLLIGPLLVYEIVVLFFLFKKIKPDILHINNGGYPAALSARAAAIAGKLAGIKKVLMVVNNMAADYGRFSRWLDYPVDRMVAHSVDLFITGSESAAARLRAVLNLSKPKVIAIHNGIAMRSATASVAATRARLGLGDFEGVIFGVVALLVPRKGHQILLNAVLKLATENKLNDKDFKILIEGHGPLRQELIDFVDKIGLARWVTFVGDEENIVDFMSALDVLILPSVQDEDFPNVILEAMSLGKPVIATRLAGTPEQVVDDVTGLLVEPRNAAQLSEAIYSLVVSKDLRNAMGHAALERFNCQFTSSKALSNYTNIYNSLLGV
jgi:glycosyltransferase involved in cell wall biosynthesis